MDNLDSEFESAPTVGSDPTIGSAPTVGSAPRPREGESVPVQTSPNVGTDSVENEVISNSNRASIEENVEVNSGNKKKRRSPAWDHFVEIYIGGKRKAECPDCKKVLGGESKNGTKHLLDHMKICLHKKQKTMKQSLLNPTTSNDGSMKLGTYTFDQDQAREELAKMIVLHEYPLRMVEHVGFRRYSHALQPLFRVVSRNTIKSDIFRIFEYERDQTMKLLESNASRIALTTDMWTSSNKKKGFMAITSHFIDTSWKLQSRLVR